MYNSIVDDAVDCQGVVGPQQMTNPAPSAIASSSSLATTMPDTQTGKAHTTKGQKQQMFFISMDGINLTSEACAMLNPENEQTSSADDVIHRKLLRRRHVRKLQKERAQRVSNATTARRFDPTVVFGQRHFSFLDIHQLPTRPKVVPPQRMIVRYSTSTRPLSMSPIRPRTLPVVDSPIEPTITMPPVSPIDTTMATKSLALDGKRVLVGIKRKLDTTFL